jgi:hypothetical protein
MISSRYKNHSYTLAFRYIGEGPEYRPREQVENHGRACIQAPVLFLQRAALAFFSLFRNGDRLAGTCHGG